MATENDSCSLPFVNHETVEKYLDLHELISSLERGFLNFSKKHDNCSVIQPVRTALEIKDHSGVLLTMPAYSSEDDALATKLVTLYPENEKFGLPSHQGVIVNFDPKTGTPTAILDAESITNLRTAAATAVATKYLAPPNAKVLAIIGSGHQAKSHYKLLSLVRDFAEVRVWSRSFEKAKTFANDIGAKAYPSVEETVKNADVIVTATLSKDPVVYGDWTKRDCLINIVGACRPDWREVDDVIMQNSQVVVDTKDGALKESGDIILSKAMILGEIGHVIGESLSIDMAKRRVFKSLGMALEDAIAARIVLKYISHSKGATH